MLSAPPTEPDVLRKGYLPHDVHAHNSDISFYINEFPLGGAENFSVARAAYALARQKLGHGDAWMRHAPWEKGYLDALGKVTIKAGQGEYVSGIDGGYLAPEVWSDRFFSLLRPFSALDRLNVTRVTVPAHIVHIPKITGDLTVNYPGENASINTSQLSFGQLSYTARKAAPRILVSNELMRDAPELADQVLRLESARAIALDRDTQALLGQGGDNPTGLINLPQVSVYYPGASASANIQTSANHATPSFNHVSQLKGKVHQLNGSTAVPTGQAKCSGIVAHTRFEQTVLTLTAAAGPWTDAQGRPLWMSDLNEGEGLLGVDWCLTNIMPTASTVGGGTASSFMVAGWWEMYVLFECLTLSFDATQEGAGFASDQTEVRITHRYDLGPAHPEAFAVLAGCDA
jgi:HK97 family phage major capsid protein